MMPPTPPPVQRRHEDLARVLYEAARTRRPVEPLTDSAPELSVDDAYLIQLAGRRLRCTQGRRLRGRKVGLTSAAIQRQFGVDRPDCGYLLDDMVLPSGAVLDVSRFIAPMVEAEIAFVLGEAVGGPHVTRADVLAATALVAPALEIIDSRIAGWRVRLVDTIADNASSGAAVVGDLVAPPAADLATLEVVMTAGGEEVCGRGAAVLGHPAEAIAMLARMLADFGEVIEPGELLLSGAVARSVPLVAGMRVDAQCRPLGSVSLHVPPAITAQGDHRHERRSEVQGQARGLDD